MSEGSTSATPEVRNAEPGPLAHFRADFLNFCRIEKGLASNSLEAYGRDLERYQTYFHREHSRDLHDIHTNTVLQYLNFL